MRHTLLIGLLIISISCGRDQSKSNNSTTSKAHYRKINELRLEFYKRDFEPLQRDVESSQFLLTQFQKLKNQTIKLQGQGVTTLINLDSNFSKKYMGELDQAKECDTPSGQMTMEDYLRYLDNGLRVDSDIYIIPESSFMPEDQYPSRPIQINSRQLRNTIQMFADLGRVTDTQEMLHGIETQQEYDHIDSRVQTSRAAREKLEDMLQASETSGDFLQDAMTSSSQLRDDLRNSNKVERVALTSLYKAQNSTKEFDGEFGQAHIALKNKFRGIQKEDIKSFKLVGMSAQSFTQSQIEYESGDKGYASQLLSFSESLLDVGLGIAPGTALVKDAYELVFGVNLVTGNELDTTDRAISFVGATVGVFTFGTAGGLATTALRSEKIAKVATHFKSLAKSFLGPNSASVLNKVPDIAIEITDTARKLGAKTKEEIADFAKLSSRILDDTGAVGNLNKSTLWTKGPKFNGVENAYSHWKKHGKTFPELNNAKEYVEKAKSFLGNPPSGTFSRTRPNGDKLFYNPTENIFGVKTKDGLPKTMFKPKAGQDY